MRKKGKKIMHDNLDDKKRNIQKTGQQKNKKKA